MIKINKIFVMLFVITLSTNIQSQDKNSTWQFTFGTNIVDLNANTKSDLGDLFNVDKNWNVSSALSMFTLSKFLGDNFSFGISGSLNSISNFANNYTFQNSVKYFASDAMLKYSLAEALNMKKIDPFIGIGLGNTWMDDKSWLTTNASIGVSYWFSEIWGLTGQVDYKNNLGYDGRGNSVMLDGGGTLRYSFGFSIKFGDNKI